MRSRRSPTRRTRHAADSCRTPRLDSIKFASCVPDAALQRIISERDADTAPESFESRSGWRADSRSYTAVDDQAALPRRADVSRPTGWLRACAPRDYFHSRLPTTMQPVVCGSVWRSADAVTAPPPHVNAFLAMRLTGVLDRLFELSAICAPNSAISASNSAISPSQRKATLRQFCRDFATHCGTGSR